MCGFTHGLPRVNDGSMTHQHYFPAFSALLLKLKREKERRSVKLSKTPGLARKEINVFILLNKRIEINKFYSFE